MRAFRHKLKPKKSLSFSHLAIIMTVSIVALGEPIANDQLTYDSDRGVKYEVGFSILGQGSAARESKPVRILPPANYSPPSSFSDSETFFKSIGKREDDPSDGSRRRR